MRLLLLIPLLLFLALVAFNKDLLLSTQTINVFGMTSIDVPLLFYSVIFFVIYSLLVMLILDSIGSFKNGKIKKLEKEVFALKSKLYDEREDELVVFMEEQKRRLADFLKKQNEESEKIKTDSEESIEQIRTNAEENIKKMILENAAALEQQKADTDRILSKLNLLDEGLISQFKKAIKGAK